VLMYSVGRETPIIITASKRFRYEFMSKEEDTRTAQRGVS